MPHSLYTRFLDTTDRNLTNRAEIWYAQAPPPMDLQSKYGAYRRVFFAKYYDILPCMTVVEKVMEKIERNLKQMLGSRVFGYIIVHESWQWRKLSTTEPCAHLLHSRMSHPSLFVP